MVNIDKTSYELETFVGKNSDFFVVPLEVLISDVMTMEERRRWIPEGLGGDRHGEWRARRGRLGASLTYGVLVTCVTAAGVASWLAERDRFETMLDNGVHLCTLPGSRLDGVRLLAGTADWAAGRALEGRFEPWRRLMEHLSPLRMAAVVDLWCEQPAPVGTAAWNWLCSLDDRAALCFAYRRIRTTADDEQRRQVLEHLFAVDADFAGRMLRRDLARTSPLAVRLAAVQGLMDDGSPASRAAVEALLADQSESPFVRREALKRLVDAPRWATAERLQALLPEDDDEIRRIAGRRLLALGPIDPTIRVHVLCALHWNDVNWFRGEIERAGQGTLDDVIRDLAVQYDLEPALVKAVIRTESNFDPQCVSRAGAQGLMQLMPVTARVVGVADPFDPRQNVEGGVRYLRRMLDRFGGNLRLALAAYNAGPTAVTKYGGVPPYPETKRYIVKVSTFLAEYRRDFGPTPAVKMKRVSR